MKKLILSIIFAASFAASASAAVEKYTIDTKGAHASINFKIQHLGYSWLHGRFNDFEGSFTIDRDNLENSAIDVVIKTASVDSNHAERDKHLRSDDFLNVEEHPTATFKSTSLELTDETSGTLIGDLTLNGVTKPVEIMVELTGEGKDPWGGYRAGFEGYTTITLKDFNIKKDLGAASADVELVLAIEGIRQ